MLSNAEPAWSQNTSHGVAMVCHSKPVGLKWLGRTSRSDDRFQRVSPSFGETVHELVTYRDITLAGLTSSSSFIVLYFGLLPTPPLRVSVS